MADYPTPEHFREAVRVEIGRRVRSQRLEVPVLPHVAQEVLALTSQANTSVRDFVNLIETDQQLSARLLKIANSPVYATLVEVTSIQRAVITIGIPVLRDLVFSVALGERIFRSRRFDRLMQQVWEHSLAVAHIAKEVATVKRTDRDFAFICGLLHDCGKPLLLETMEALAKKSDDPALFAESLVDETLREYHTQAGGLMARSWRFPDKLHAAIRYHHEYQQAEAARPMALLVQAANLFAHALGFGSYAAEVDVDLRQEMAISDLQLSTDEILTLQKTLPKTTRALITSFAT